MSGFPSRSSVLLCLTLGFAAAAAASDVTTDGEPDRAEYVRLQQELEKLAARSAWAGVERTYQKIVGTGVKPSFQSYVSAAHAARAVGNIGAARQRLLAANDLHEDREILDWLWDIDANYGRASLACTLNKQKVDLEVETMPFNPDHRRAVEFAMAQIAERCAFDGYLPQGNYAFGGFELKITPRVQSVSLDLRNMELPSSGKKKRKKD